MVLWWGVGLNLQCCQASAKAQELKESRTEGCTCAWPCLQGVRSLRDRPFGAQRVSPNGASDGVFNFTAGARGFPAPALHLQQS